MTVNSVAVIDNTVLRNLYEVNLLHHLSLYYSRVYVPVEVEKEFLGIKDLAREQQRLEWLFLMYKRHQSWFKKCNFYSDAQVRILSATAPPRIHRGELEAAAQRGYLPASQIPVLLCDERRFRDYCRNEAWPARGTLSLLADLHLRFALCDYFAYVEHLSKAQRQRFSPQLVVEVFERMRNELTGG